MAMNVYSFIWNSGSANALTFGGAGSPFQISDIDGLAGLPDLRVQDADQGYNDGMFSGRDFLSGRSIVMNVNVFAGNGNTAQQNLDLFTTALVPQQSGTTLCVFQLSATDSQQRFSGRVRARKVVIDPEYTFGYIKTQVHIFCPDPRLYDDAAQTLSMAAQTTATRSYSKTFSYTYGTPPNYQSNTITATNSGNITSYPVITITGPVTNPVILNQTTGDYLQVNTTLALTDNLVLDLLNRTVTLNGSTARNLLANQSDWFGFPPGNTILYLNGSGMTVGVTAATVVFRNAYV